MEVTKWLKPSDSRCDYSSHGALPLIDVVTYMFEPSRHHRGGGTWTSRSGCAI
jgi:hypothetical protein